MRTTVTLDSDTTLLLREFMSRRGLGFKQALNEAVRAGLATDRAPQPFTTQTFEMGQRPEVSLDKALKLSAELEDAELARRLDLRK